MKYEMCPVIDICDLEEALTVQYGPDEVFSGVLRPFLFGDDYINDSYKSFSFDELEIYEGKSWQNEEYIRIMNCIKAFLQDVFPNHKKVLIDVSW